jgi:hypothetical protein
MTTPDEKQPVPFLLTLRDDGMSYGDYPSTTLWTGVELLLYLGWVE